MFQVTATKSRKFAQNRINKQKEVSVEHLEYLLTLWSNDELGGPETEAAVIELRATMVGGMREHKRKSAYHKRFLMVKLLVVVLFCSFYLWPIETKPIQWQCCR